MKRCGWVRMNKFSVCSYHDEEWGHLPMMTRRFFELLCMETHQAGLSWKRCSHNAKPSVKLFMDIKLSGRRDD